MRTRPVLIVLFDQVQSLDVTGPLEVLAEANTWLQSRGDQPVYEISTAGLDARAVRASSGLRLTPDVDLNRAPTPDVLLAPGGEGAHAPEPGLVAWLREHAPRARQVVSVCTGAFLLAEAGMLSGRRATTHWEHCADLAERFPDVDVAAEPIYVRDGNLATSARVTAGIDLALALVEEDLGREAALSIARHLVVFLRRPGNQAQFSTQLATQTAQRDPLRQVQQWIAEHPDADLSVGTLAERASLSPRQFTRVFAEQVGITPGRYVDQVRLEAARRRLEDTRDSVEETALACGFDTPEAMRRAFVRALGVAPSDYRSRFRPVPSGFAEEGADAHRGLAV
ncbi:GlxA family transcriptional regulator [Actinopolyspora saharensis]|uniref:GlxA family transcriptional regulator n=1 Tax=Actinopolyspora saharensis TaxID=995062 RepID=UPI003F669C35